MVRRPKPRLRIVFDLVWFRERRPIEPPEPEQPHLDCLRVLENP
jgi:hypothetical protein